MIRLYDQNFKITFIYQNRKIIVLSYHEVSKPGSINVITRSGY